MCAVLLVSVQSVSVTGDPKISLPGAISNSTRKPEPTGFECASNTDAVIKLVLELSAGIVSGTDVRYILAGASGTKKTFMLSVAHVESLVATLT